MYLAYKHLYQPNLPALAEIRDNAVFAPFDVQLQQVYRRADILTQAHRANSDGARHIVGCSGDDVSSIRPIRQEGQGGVGSCHSHWQHLHIIQTERLQVEGKRMGNVGIGLEDRYRCAWIAVFERNDTQTDVSPAIKDSRCRAQPNNIVDMLDKELQIGVAQRQGIYIA